MKFYNFNEDLKIVFLGDYSGIQEADVNNNDSEQIVIVDFEDLLLWKNDLEKIKETIKADDFIFVLADNLMFKLIEAYPNEESLDNVLDNLSHTWVLQGKENFETIYNQVIKYTQKF